MSYLIPKDLRYTKTHEWVKDLGGNKYRVGITDYAAKHIGDVTYVGLPAVESTIRKEESIWSSPPRMSSTRSRVR